MRREYTASSALLRVFRDYIFPHKLSALCALASMVLFAGSVTKLIKGVEPLINNIFSAEPNLKATLFMSMTLLGVSLVRGLAEFGQNFCIKYIGYRAICSLQVSLFSSFIRADIGYVRSQPIGHIISRLTNDVLLTRSLLVVFFSGCARHVLLMLFLIVELLRMDFAVSLSVFCIFPLVGCVVALLGKRLRRIVADVQHELANYTSRIAHVFGAIELVKSFSAVKSEIKSAEDQMLKIRELYKNKLLYDSTTLLIVEYMNGLIVCGLLLYWAASASVGNVQGGPGRLTALLMAFAAFYRPFKGMMSLNGPLQEGLAAAIRVFKVLDESELRKGERRGISIISPCALLLKDVRLSFEQKEILNNCSIEIRKGEIVGVVGGDGSGKSSIIGILAGHILQSEGKVVFETPKGCHAMEDVDSESVTHNIGLMPQNAFLFPDHSILENLTYGKAASLAQVQKVIGSLGLNPFIDSLPKGIVTLVGDCSISNREKRLLCLARLLLKDCAIMLLDEPFCDLDKESAELTCAALLFKKEFKATLITSKNANLEIADRVFTLREGRLVELSGANYTEELAGIQATKEQVRY